MTAYFQALYAYLINMPRSVKKIILLSADSFFVPLSLYAAYALRLDAIYPFDTHSNPGLMFATITIVGVIAVYLMSLHRIKLHTFEGSTVVRIGICSILVMLSFVFLIYFFRFWTPRSVPVIFAVLFFILSTTARLLGAQVLLFLQSSLESTRPVAIYGAGAAGIQLISALRRTQEYTPKVLVDDNPALQDVIVAGLKVEPPQKLEALITTNAIKRVILAVPSISAQQKQTLLTRLRKLPCEIHVLPSFVEMLSGDLPFSTDQAVMPADLLGREAVDLKNSSMAKAYAGRFILITGAGGSIGSELCRQLLQCNPACIVMYDQNEFALFELENELKDQANAIGIKLVACLGSVTSQEHLERTLRKWSVDVLLHAAAYKHVPMVEANEIEGARNNIVGTYVATQAAVNAKIERFIMVSTDKAVRPTNIMGATKRLAEIVVQNQSTLDDNTNFSIVRFGNVLGSSGSVIPIFQKQIAGGGPVTITHPEITRYFMTIEEASRLVLLAGAYSSGADVFVLDMGSPVKIADLAQRMIEMMGKTVKSPANDEGDIEITYTGLRPGEKLYEELLLDSECLVSTPHKKILRAKEAFPSAEEVQKMLNELEAIIIAHDHEALRSFVASNVDGFHIQETV